VCDPSNTVGSAGEDIAARIRDKLKLSPCVTVCQNVGAWSFLVRWSEG
jgi:hypothetical protein